MPRLITYYQKLLGKNAPWFRLNIRVFVAGLVVGFLAMMFFFEPILQLVQQGLDALAEIATNVDETNYIGKVWIIWQNNMLTTGVMIFSGFFLGYLSLLAMFSNALIIGALFVVAGSEGLGGILTIIVSDATWRVRDSSLDHRGRSWRQTWMGMVVAQCQRQA